VTGKSVGLALAGSQGTIAVRITTSTLHNCTIFGPATIVKDAPGRFVAKPHRGPASVIVARKRWVARCATTAYASPMKRATVPTPARVQAPANPTAPVRPSAATIR